MGGGALSSNVSKLGSKEVIRHAELVSASQSKEVSKEVSKKLRNFSLAPLGRGVKGEGLKVEGKCARKSRKVAFTLAEVLITLGIIGVVVALTLPSIVHNVQKVILKDQFKRAYSNFYNAIKYTQAQNGAPYACFYWTKNPYGDYICTKENKYGECVKWALKDGTPLPNDYNGKFSDCKKFTEDLMKALNTVKFCETKPLENGCITDNYRGIDKVLEEKNPNKKQDPDQMYSDKQIKEKYPTFITADGVLYSRYAAMDGSPYFMMDVNGHKGPNKWGYDIFWFMLRGDEVNGITKISPASWAIEKGGTTMNAILSGK